MGFKRSPCKKRPKGITAASFFKATMGKAAYKKSKEKKAAKYRANAEQLKHKQKDRYRKLCEALRLARKPKRTWVRRS